MKIFALSLVFALCFWACSDDNASNASPVEDSSGSFETVSSGTRDLSSASEIPAESSESVSLSSANGDVFSSSSEWDASSSSAWDGFVSSSDVSEPELFSSADVGSSSSQISVPFDEIVSAAELSAAQLERAEEFRKTVLDSLERTRNAVYVYTKTVGDFSGEPEKLAARIALLGFRDVYLSPGKSLYTNPNDWIRTFIRTLGKYGIKVHAQRLPVTGSGSAELLTSESGIDAEVGLVTGYNGLVEPDERFSGLNADIEVHTIKSGFAYSWDKGAGSDSLLRMAQSALEYAKRKLESEGLELSEAVAMSYDKYYNEGTFANGSSGHFLKSCDWVVLMDYYTKDSQIQRYAKASFDNATKNRSVSVALKVKGTGSDAFQNWEPLLASLRALFAESIDYRNANGFAPFRGLDFFTYEGLENLWFNG